MENASRIDLIAKKDELGTMLPIDNAPEFDENTGEWDLWFAYEDLQCPERSDDLTHVGFSSEQAAINCVGEIATQRALTRLELEEAEKQSQNQLVEA
jgi:hypothetical protein